MLFRSIEKVLQFLEFSRCCSLDDAFRKGTPYTKGDLLKMLEWLNEPKRAVHDNVILKVVPYSPYGATVPQRCSSYPHLQMKDGIITHIQAGHRSTRMNQNKEVILRKHYDCIDREMMDQWAACEAVGEFDSFKHKHSRCQLSIPPYLIHRTKSRFLPSILALGIVDNGNKLQTEQLDESELRNEIEIGRAHV